MAVLDQKLARPEHGRPQNLVNHAGAGDLAVEQGVRRGGGAVREEALAGADDDGEDQQAVLVELAVLAAATQPSNPNRPG